MIRRQIFLLLLLSMTLIFPLCAQSLSSSSEHSFFLPANDLSVNSVSDEVLSTNALSNNALLQTNSAVPEQFVPWRAAIFGGLVLGTYGAAYGVVFSKGWWDEQGNHFHFENDFDYALNIDKLGHAYSGLLMGEFFYDGLRWSGLSQTASRAWAATGSFLTHVAIDVKDGFAPTWGFSVWDVLAGTVGGLWPWMQELWSPLSALDFKASYFLHSDVYWNKGGESSQVFTDDYVNWTFWLSWKVHRALPSAAARWWPEWLCIAAGLSLDDDGVLGRPTGKRELYLALDYDLDAIFKPKRHVTQRAVRWFNMIKLPSPAVRILPSGRQKFFLFYPIQF